MAVTNTFAMQAAIVAFEADREEEELRRLKERGRVRVETDDFTQEEIDKIPALLETLKGEPLVQGMLRKVLDGVLLPEDL